MVSEDKLPNETVKEHDVEHKDIKHDHAVKEHEEHEHDSRETIERQRQQQDCINEDDQDENVRCVTRQICSASKFPPFNFCVHLF